jgi:hypothetical protein
MPDDPAERFKVLAKMNEMTKQFLKDNPGSDWGAFIGENQGYGTGVKSAADIIKLQMMFAPYVRFKVYQAASVDEVWDALKSMMPQK